MYIMYVYYVCILCMYICCKVHIAGYQRVQNLFQVIYKYVQCIYTYIHMYRALSNLRPHFETVEAHQCKQTCFG